MLDRRIAKPRPALIRASMILLSLAVLPQAALAAAPQVKGGAGGEVITADDANGHKVVVVRDGSRPDRLSGAHQVLIYGDDEGRVVKVYSDHAVNRQQVEAQLQWAREQGERARAAGRRAAEDGLRAAEEGRRAAAEARIEAAQAREEGMRAAAEGRRAAMEALRATEQARADATQAVSAGMDARRPVHDSH